MAAPKKSPAKPAKKSKPVVEAARDGREKINGYVRPAKGSATGIVWDIADALAAKGKEVSRADVLTKAEAKGVNPATAATQYHAWRAFNGMVTQTGPRGPRQAKAKPAKKPPAKPAAKKAAPAKVAAKKKPAVKKAVKAKVKPVPPIATSEAAAQ